MTDTRTAAEEWCSKIAALAVDALLDAGILQQECLMLAKDIVATEILVRLCMGDNPPSAEADRQEPRQ